MRCSDDKPHSCIFCGEGCADADEAWNHCSRLLRDYQQRKRLYDSLSLAQKNSGTLWVSPKQPQTGQEMSNYDSELEEPSSKTLSKLTSSSNYTSAKRIESTKVITPPEASRQQDRLPITPSPNGEVSDESDVDNFLLEDILSTFTQYRPSEAKTGVEGLLPACVQTTDPFRRTGVANNTISFICFSVVKSRHLSVKNSFSQFWNSPVSSLWLLLCGEDCIVRMSVARCCLIACIHRRLSKMKCKICNIKTIPDAY